MIKEKIEIMSIIDNFKRLANTIEFRCKKNLLTNLEKILRSNEKMVINGFKNDIKYLQDCIDYLNNLFESYTAKNKSDEIETIRYLFDDNVENYDLHPINNKQYQSFSDKNLLPFREYLKRIRASLIVLMSDGCKVKLNVNIAFRSEKFKKSNDKINIYIKSKNTTDIDEIFAQLIEKHEKLNKSLKDKFYIRRH